MFNKGTVDGLKQSIVFFNRAVQEDREYALAHDGLADAYAELGREHSLPPEEAFSKAKEEAAAALAINPDLAEAHITLGEVLASHWDWKGAETELQLD